MYPEACSGENMHPALSIHEVLMGIFVLLPHKSNARNAQVCKTWSPIALDCLWRDIIDVGDLIISLAGALKEDGHGEWVRH